MASSYSTDLGIELMVTGENSGTWGDKTNTNLNLIQQAIAGYEEVSIAGGAQTTALAMTDGALSNARNAVIKFTGTITGNQIVTITDGIEKVYIMENGTTGAFTVQVKTVSGSGVTFATDDKGTKILFSNGTDIVEVPITPADGTITTAKLANAAVQTTKISDNAVTTAKISNANVTSAKIADNAITTTKISNLNVTTAKIADDAITPDKLSNTAVTAGSYTLASITVDAQGRLTSASSGAAGGAEGYSLTEFRRGSDSFTYSATDTSATKASGLISGGGGGGGRSNQGAGGRPGGHGFFGVWAVDVAPGTLNGTSVQVGAGGSGGGAGQAGQTGGTSNFGNVVNAGGGSGGASPHTPDSPRPGAGNTNTPSAFNYSTSDFTPSTTNVAPPSPGTGGNSSNGPNSNRDSFSIGGQGAGTPAGSGTGGDGYIYIFEQIT